MTKEEKSLKMKEYYKKNRERIIEYNKNYYREHIEEVKERQNKHYKKYYQTHKKERNKKTKEYYRKNINKGIEVWEKVYGELPKGCKILHLDGNKDNNKLNNLVMITNNEMCIINKKGLKLNMNKELTKTSILLARLSMKQNKIEKR